MIGLLLWAVVIIIIGVCTLGWTSLMFVPIFFLGLCEGNYGKGNLPWKTGITLVVSALILGGIGIGMEFDTKLWGILAIPTFALMFYLIYKFDKEIRS